MSGKKAEKKKDVKQELDLDKMASLLDEHLRLGRGGTSFLKMKILRRRKKIAKLRMKAARLLNKAALLEAKDKEGDVKA